MANFLHINKEKLVVNIFIADSITTAQSLFNDATILPLEDGMDAAIGDTWDDETNTFIKPEPVVLVEESTVIADTQPTE